MCIGAAQIGFGRFNKLETQSWVVMDWGWAGSVGEGEVNMIKIPCMKFSKELIQAIANCKWDINR